MSRSAGLVRNDGVVVTSALGTDHILLQSAPTSTANYAKPKLITVTNLLASPGDFTTLNLGSSGVAGQLNIYPSTAATGNMRFVDNAATGNFLTTITRANQGQASVISFPDPGASTANVVLSQGAATIAGVKTFSSVPLGTQYVVQIFLSPITALAGLVVVLHSAQFSGTVTGVSISVNAAFTSTNIVATTSVYHSGSATPITTGAVTLATSGSAAGSTASVTPTAANTFVAGDAITAAVTGGVGTVNGVISLLITRTA